MCFRNATKDFEGSSSFLFVQQSGSESLAMSTQVPEPENIKKKCLICVKARAESDEPGFETGIANEVVFMEINKPVLNNLYSSCQVRVKLLSFFFSFSKQLSKMNNFVILWRIPGLKFKFYGHDFIKLRALVS